MLVTFILVAVNCLIASAEYETGYYWLDYSGGPISKNCLKLDKNSDVYVGQVYKKPYELLPASVRTRLPFATGNAYDVTYKTNKQVKIVCSQFPENFKWVRTNFANYLSVPDLVLSGEEVGIDAYIGRAYENDKAYLGKIGKVLVYPVGSKTRYTSGPFDVLTYTKPDDDDASSVICPR